MTTASLLPARSRRRERLRLTGLAACALAALAWAAFVSPQPRLVYNPSESVAVGWYRIAPLAGRADALSIGSVVLVRLPTAAAAFAALRGYLPSGVPLLKPVAAIAPQHVCAVGREVRIDGVQTAIALRADRRGRPLRAWHGCRPLRPGELFLLSANPASFDSRYVGPIRVKDVLGIAHPLRWETRP
ncbi:S26 family signal peptidase [Luteibacter jiangsuensis]